MKKATQSEIRVFCQVLEGGQIPFYASSEAAGCDLYASRDMLILPGETVLIPTALKIALPEGYEAQVRPRSGMSLKTDLRISNSPGTIDSDYRGEISVIASNGFNQANLPYLALQKPELAISLCDPLRWMSLSDFWKHQGISPEQTGKTRFPDLKIFLDGTGLPYGTIRIQKGDRIAQLIIAKACRAEFIPCDEVSTIGSDRGGGFGSTGQ